MVRVSITRRDRPYDTKVLHKEIREWLKEMGIEPIQVSCRDSLMGMDIDKGPEKALHYSAFFENAREATLFKLTFGGVE